MIALSGEREKTKMEASFMCIAVTWLIANVAKQTKTNDI